MTRRILDTSVLISFWHHKRQRRPLEEIASGEPFSWANELTSHYKTKLIATPVVVEFLAGATTAAEVRYAASFLTAFQVVDRGVIPAVDWDDARRIAERVPRDGKPRQLGDCLIKAIANRFRCSVIASDKRLR